MLNMVNLKRTNSHIYIFIKLNLLRKYSQQLAAQLWKQKIKNKLQLRIKKWTININNITSLSILSFILIVIEWELIALQLRFNKHSYDKYYEKISGIKVTIETM